MRDLIPLAPDTMPCSDVLYVNPNAPAAHLHAAAARRLSALEDLLLLLEDCPDELPLKHLQVRLAAALVPLAAEARHLYKLADEKRR
ncbi:hypothetical protein [Pseudomonas citronellolis]|uniref:hypothetical protein n=1 Tax=Pseudomonas citronellolis TaxID=53408 RepID=UPI0023E401B6|nr:hypothetical protein [Pseudomonas citronellolis]MDF3933982.1 hypothetical protein [Pseudomonas citronellolis]